MKFLKYYILLILTIILHACSASVESTDTSSETGRESLKFVNEVDLIIDRNVSWINLMPGAKPKFHISGRFGLLKSDNYDFNVTKLKFIKIYQSGNELYSIMPKIREELDENRKNITYSTISGLTINQEMKTERSVDFELIFSQGNEELMYRIENVNIEEVQ